MSVLDGACGCTLLHEGGEARIYRVRAGDRTLVLKWYADGVRIDPHSVEVLLHDRIAGAYRVVETGEREGRAYIVYEFIDGGESDVFSPLPPAVALDSLRRVARTLAELSKRGVHHGDLSPSNVIFGRDGLPVVIDCGIVGPGAPAFAAPERFQGKPATEKSDLYSLGMLLYYWLAGEPLISAVDFDAYAAAANSADSLDPTTALFARGIPAETLSRLEPLWKGLLRSSPEDRVEDFDELDELLEIAFDAECGGEVVWNSTRKAFNESSRGGRKLRIARRFCGDKAHRAPPFRASPGRCSSYIVCNGSGVAAFACGKLRGRDRQADALEIPRSRCRDAGCRFVETGRGDARGCSGIPAGSGKE